jgi:gas vesicle protein GvpL/GvpF
MSESRATGQRSMPARAGDTPGREEGAVSGLYLYGITRYLDDVAVRLPDAVEGNDGEHVRLAVGGGLAAVVRRTLLVPSANGTLELGVSDVRQLEAMVRHHNDVVSAIHAQRAILPAKFGCVYASEEDVLSALAGERDALLALLERLEGCDEWGVHIYANPALIGERLVAEDPRIRRLREELAVASPGKAYLLKRRLADLEAEVAQASLDLMAREIHAALARHALDDRATIPPHRPPTPDVGVEVLRAAYLIRREASTAFFAELDAVGARAGVRCEQSGPWPPYSFAVPASEAGKEAAP